MINFEKAKGYENLEFNLPQRKTANSAGYDFEVIEDMVIPSFWTIIRELEVKSVEESIELKETYHSLKSLEETASLTKKYNTKPTLVPTGVKCKLEPDTYLELSVRSSCPLKYWLVMANGVGRLSPKF